MAALGLVSAGIYYQWYVPQSKPFKEIVIEVNDTRFDMAYYIDALKYQLGDIPSQQIPFFLDIIVDGIQRNELIRQESLEMGITISDAQVDDEIKNGELPNNQAVRDITRTQLLVQKLREDFFNEQVPISAEQRHIMAMFLESESQANGIRERLISGEDFSHIAGDLSLDGYTLENNGDLGWKPEGIVNGLLLTSILEEYIFSYPVGEVVVPVRDVEKTKDIGYWLIEILERNDETKEAHVQAMTLSSEEEAQIVLQRLEEDDDFTVLAEEYSQSWSEEEGADLGWLTEGDVSEAFSEFVFNSETELGIYGEPIRDEGINTEGGYWLFKIPDSDIREISDEDRDILIEQAIQDWLGSLLENPENIVTNYLDDKMREFAISKFSE
jgi:parvulin-like peptidyl-prolyl isomerase